MATRRVFPQVGGGVLAALFWIQPAQAQPTPAAQPTPVPGLPGSDIVTPPPPPSLQAPAADAPTPAPAASQLMVPQDPLQVRIVGTQGITLKEALELATRQNPQIQQAQLGVQGAQASLDQARAAYAPTLRSTASYTYQQPPQTTARGPVGAGFVDSSTFAASLLRLDYTFIDGGGRDARVQAAEQQLAIARLTLDQTQQTVKASVAEAYYNLQNADAQVAINQAAVESAQATLRDAEAQERAGLGTRFDVLRSQTELANNRQTLLRSQNDQQQARRSLAQILNFAVPTDVIASDPIAPAGQWDLSLEETIIKAFQSRQELEIQRRSLEQARANARSARASTQPQGSLFATFDAGKNLQANQDIAFGYSAGTSLSFLFSDGGAAEAQARGFEIQGQTAASRFDQSRNDIRQAVENAFLSLSSTREQIDSSKVAIASAEESLRLSRLRFQAGVGTQTEVISAEAALTTARGNLSSAIVGYNRALAQLQRAVSGL